MSWHMIQVEVRDTGRITSQVGQARETREAARDDVASILRRGNLARPSVFGPARQAWRDGPDDDTLALGPFVWSVIEALVDPVASAQVWLDEYAQLVSEASESPVTVERPELMDGS